MIAILNGLLLGSLAYGVMGLVFGVWFVFFRLKQLDSGARNAGWGFRLLILPGVVALWVIFAKRVWCGEGIPGERSAHWRI